MRSYRDRQASRPDPGQQLVQVGQARQRLPRMVPGIGAQHAEQAAGLGQRLRAVLDTSRIASDASPGARVTARSAPSDRATIMVR